MLTNKYSLPQQIVSSVENDPYKKTGHISATSLIQPSRIIQLRERYAKDIVEDASDRIWSLFGQAIHKVLERSDQTGAIHEERMSIFVNGWELSCQTDAYCTMQKNEAGQYEKIKPTIRDYKFVKMFADKFDHSDWREQLNINAHIWIQNGFPVEKLEVCMIFRDWAPGEAARIRDYPPPIKTMNIALWDLNKRTEFVAGKIAAHQMATKLPDEMLPFCTPQEQWRKDSKWAVHRLTNPDKAVRLFDTMQDATNYIDDHEGSKVVGRTTKFMVKHRPAQAMRCEHYCNVNKFCNQYALEKKREERRGVQEGV